MTIEAQHIVADAPADLVLADRVRRERGWDIVAHPDLAYEALPSDLADLVTRPPDLRLADAQYLSALLDRIESP